MKKFKNPWAKGGQRWNESVLRSSAVDQISTPIKSNSSVPGAMLDFKCYKDLLDAWTTNTKPTILYDLSSQLLLLNKTESILELDAAVRTIASSVLGQMFEIQSNCQCCGILIAVEGQDLSRPSPKDDAIIEYLQSTPSQIDTGGATSNDFKTYDFDLSFDDLLILGLVVTPPINVRTKNNIFPIRMMIKSGFCCPT